MVDSSDGDDSTVIFKRRPYSYRDGVCGDHDNHRITSNVLPFCSKKEVLSENRPRWFQANIFKALLVSEKWWIFRKEVEMVARREMTPFIVAVLEVAVAME